MLLLFLLLRNLNGNLKAARPRLSSMPESEGCVLLLLPVCSCFCFCFCYCEAAEKSRRNSCAARYRDARVSGWPFQPNDTALVLAVAAVGADSAVGSVVVAVVAVVGHVNLAVLYR